MEDLVIRKTDILNFGRKTMKEVYEFLNDDYILSTFEEMKVEKERLEENIVIKHLKMIHGIDTFKYSEKQYEDFNKDLNDKSKYDSIQKEMLSKIEDESLDIEIIYYVLERMKLEFEINEDLYVEKKAFIYFFSVYYLYNDYI